MSVKEQIQSEILEEIKTIAKELSQINTFSGLLMHQQNIQILYEKYVFLKQLNSFKYQQLIDEATVETLDRDNQKKNSKDMPRIVAEQVEEKITEIVSEQKTKAEFFNKEEVQLAKVIEETVQPEPSAEVVSIEIVEKKEESTPEIKEEELREKLTPISVSIADIKYSIEKKEPERGREKILLPIKLDFNDSIAFISQLFDGNKSAMDMEFRILNETRSIDESKAWMEQMFHKYNWRDKAEYVERLSGLIVNRFI